MTNYSLLFLSVDNNVNAYEPDCILGITNSNNNSSETLSEITNVSKLVKQKDEWILDGNVIDELQLEVSSDNLLLEHNLNADIIDQSEMNVNNDFTLDCSINSTITSLFEELNNLNPCSNIVTYQNTKENNIFS